MLNRTAEFSGCDIFDNASSLIGSGGIRAESGTVVTLNTVWCAETKQAEAMEAAVYGWERCKPGWWYLC
jgi:hypothetical protein